MANEISDLVVRAKPEGLDETSEGFGQMQNDLEDTEEQMEETTGGLEELGTRWSGAMNAIVAGLAVGTGGLLTQVPVVGEAMGGLGSVIDALAFKMDQTLRPVLSDATNEFYDLSNEIYKSDGILEGLEAVGDKIADLGSATIEVAVEENVAEVAASDMLTFVFPELGKSDIVSALFSFDLSNAAILTTLFGGTAIATSKILSFVFGATISAPAILGFVFASLTGGAILSFMFDDINMTEGTIISAVFGGIAITAASLLSMPTWPIIGAGAVVAAISWPTITTSEIIMSFQSDRSEAMTELRANNLDFGSVAPYPDVTGSDIFNDDGTLREDRAQFGTNDQGQLIELDGRQLTEDTGQYRFNGTASRGRFP